MKPAGDPPLCDCHGEPMLWSSDRKARNGGYWRCRPASRVRGLASSARYRQRHPDRIAQTAMRQNPLRVFVSGMYLGRIGFTDSEVKEMISGSSD